MFFNPQCISFHFKWNGGWLLCGLVTSLNNYNKVLPSLSFSYNIIISLLTYSCFSSFSKIIYTNFDFFDFCSIQRLVYKHEYEQLTKSELDKRWAHAVHSNVIIQGRIRGFQIEGAQTIIWTQRTSQGPKRQSPTGPLEETLLDLGCINRIMLYHATCMPVEPILYHSDTKLDLKRIDDQNLERARAYCAPPPPGSGTVITL